MNTIKKWAYKILYALPFGMKAADEEIMGGNSSSSDEGQSVHQQVSDERVAKHLLKGEITQPVKELRYRTYKVDDEAKNYEYLGGGTAIKKEEAKKKAKEEEKKEEKPKQIAAPAQDKKKKENKKKVETVKAEIVPNDSKAGFSAKNVTAESKLIESKEEKAEEKQEEKPVEEKKKKENE